MLGLHFQNMFNQTLYWEILAVCFFSYLIFKNHKCVTNNRQQNQTRFPHYNKTRNSKPQTGIKKFFCWNRPPRALSCSSKRPSLPPSRQDKKKAQWAKTVLRFLSAAEVFRGRSGCNPDSVGGGGGGGGFQHFQPSLKPLNRTLRGNTRLETAPSRACRVLP